MSFSRDSIIDLLRESQETQGRIKEFAKGGGDHSRSLSSSPLPSIPPLPMPLRSKDPEISQRVWESAEISPLGPGAKPRPKTNMVHSKAARKPLVAIILNILSTMFYSRTINICHISLNTTSDGVSPSNKGERAEPARPPPL